MKGKYRLKRLVIAGILLLLSTGLAYAAFTVQYVIHATTTAMLTPNSIANNGFTAASATTYDNTQGQTGNGYVRCKLQIVLAFPAAPTAGAAVYLWFLESIDGSNFADTPSSTITTKAADAAIAISTGTGQTTTRQIVTVPCPAGLFKMVAQLANTGQTTNASGNTISLRQNTLQGN